MTTNPDYWTTAERILTRDELYILKLAEHGLGRRRLALILHVAPGTARDRLNRARQKVAEALDQETAA